MSRARTGDPADGRPKRGAPAGRLRGAARLLAAGAFASALASASAGASAGAASGASDAEPAPHTVSFPTADGGVVWADEYGSGDRGVVLAHGGRFDKSSWAEQAPALAAAGFRVVAIDFRGRGRSQGGDTLPKGDDGLRFDVLAAVRHLRSTGAVSVAVVGGSMGGGAAAEAAVEAPGEIDRLVLLAHSTIEHPERLGGRKLFVVARDDPYADGSPRLTAVRNQFERAPEPKELVVLDGAAHAQFLFDTDQAERLLAEIVRFLTAP